MALHPKQIESVMALPGPERYDHFIKQIVDGEKVWGLYNNGWALASTDDGTQVFPVWPAEDYAAKCAQDEWSGYEPISIALNDFIEELLPMLERDGVIPGVFYTPTNKGITPEITQLIEDINHELGHYE